MRIHAYVRDRKAYIPTVARTTAGYYIEIEPVEVVSPIKYAKLIDRLKWAFDRGNQLVPTPSRRSFPTHVVLKFSGAKSLDSFERGTSLWNLEGAEGAYVVMRLSKCVEGGWSSKPEWMERLPAKSSIQDAIQVLAKEMAGGLQ